MSISSSKVNNCASSAPNSPCPRTSTAFHGKNRQGHSSNSNRQSSLSQSFQQSQSSQSSFSFQYNPPVPSNTCSYAQEAIRIYARLVGSHTDDGHGHGTESSCDGGTGTSGFGSGDDNNSNSNTKTHSHTELRRFSVDPSITNLESLRHLVGRAFDLKGDFGIHYETIDDYRNPIILPMVSDWDLSAAFLGASDPDLKLLIKPSLSTTAPNPVILDGYDSSSYEVISGLAAHSSWELIGSGEVGDGPTSSYSQPPRSPQQRDSMYRDRLPTQNGNTKNTHLKMVPNHHRTTTGAVIPSNAPKGSSAVIPGAGIPSLNFNTAGLINTMEKWMQKALTLVEDFSVPTAPSRPPLSDTEFRSYLDPAGVLLNPLQLRWACYHGGIEPSLRKVVWKHLLCIYPPGLSGHGRMEYVKRKSAQYFELRNTWKSHVQNGVISEEFSLISNMVRKDVVRTDRSLPFYAGHDDNPNIASLFNILTTFALNHPKVSYCQGMSDLASPLLVSLGDEAQAYLCFCALMERLSPNFSSDGIAMSLLFAHLSQGVAHYDPEFWDYLKGIGADDLLFCYRWLLLELKREFAFEDALKMMEVLWASLPYKPQEVPLWEVKYTGTGTPISSATATTTIPTHTPSIPIPAISSGGTGGFSNTASYSKIAAIRRASGSHSHSWRSRHFARSSYKSKATSKSNTPTHHQYFSLDDSSTSSTASSSGIENSYCDKRQNPRTRANFYSLDESTLEISCPDVSSSSPFEILTFGSAVKASDKENLQKTALKSPPKKLIKNLREFWTIGAEAAATDDEVFTENSMRGRSQITSDSEADSGHPGDEEDEQESLEFSGTLPGITQNQTQPPPQLPTPEEFGGGNPFLMFLCLTLLLQHRNTIIRNGMDYNETAMYFDKMVRRHPVTRILNQARSMYSNYLKSANVAASLNLPMKSIT